MKKATFIYLLMLIGVMPLIAQSNLWIRHYDRNDNGLNEHVYGIRQDKQGIIWLNTYGGLYSFDGQRFVSHKDSIVARPQSGYHWSPKTKMEHWFYEMTQNDPKLLNEKLWMLCSLNDRDGNLWVGSSNGLWLISKEEYPFHLIEYDKEVLCLYKSAEGHIWMTTREGYICLLDHSLRPMAYVTPTGEWSKTEVKSGMVVMNMMEAADGSLWLSARSSGLVRLQKRSADVLSGFYITYIRDDGSLHGGLHALENVYATCMDYEGRIWTASLKTGLGMITNKAAVVPDDIVHCNSLLKRTGNANALQQGALSNRFRCFLPVYRDEWLAGSDDGLYYIKPSTWQSGKAGIIKELLPPRESDVTNDRSIQCLLCDVQGRIFAGTSGYGLMVLHAESELSALKVSRILSKEQDNLPSNVLYNLVEDGSKVWGFCDNGLFFVSSDDGGESPASVSIACFRSNDSSPWPTMSIGNALMLEDGRMVKGTHKGLLWFYPDSIGSRRTKHAIFTEARYEWEKGDTSVVVGDTLLLPKGTSEVSLYCSVLDYNRLADVVYAYRVSNVDSVWSYTSDPEIVFSNLPSGYSEIVVRATNGDGLWSGSERRLTVYVEPESDWKAFLIVGLVLLYVITVYFLYRKRPEDKQTEDVPHALKPILDSIPTKDVMEEQFRNDVIHHIKNHIGESEFGPEQLAKEIGLSKTMLLTKIKSSFGTVPVEVISRVRIQAATELLKNTELTIAEIAYRTGYNDPKYFSRVYKKITGASPSEIRNKDK